MAGKFECEDGPHALFVRAKQPERPHANELRRYAQKLDGAPCTGDTRTVMRLAAAYIEDLELRLRGAEATTAAARDVLAERRRQIDAEGWTPDHDDEHAPGEMSQAAACYAKYGDWVAYRNTAPNDWPWHESWWKPSDSRRNLVKAAALILAEIERLDRIEPPKNEG